LVNLYVVDNAWYKNKKKVSGNIRIYLIWTYSIYSGNSSCVTTVQYPYIIHHNIMLISVCTKTLILLMPVQLQCKMRFSQQFNWSFQVFGMWDVSLSEQSLTCHRTVLCSGLGSSNLHWLFVPENVGNYSFTDTVSDLRRVCNPQEPCLEVTFWDYMLCNANCCMVTASLKLPSVFVRC
jgi:hypothetical protein